MTTSNTLPTVLVTGAGGFVCRHVVQALAMDGWQVFAVDRAFDSTLTHRWRDRWGDQVRLIEGDLMQLPPMSVDALVHGAALTADADEAGHSPIENLRANLDPLLSVLEWAYQNTVSRILCVSSTGVYVEAKGTLQENTPPAPLGMYAVAKTALEYTADTLRRVHGCDAHAVRLGYVYGPDEATRATRPRVSRVAQLVQSALSAGRMWINPSQIARDWTFAPDIGCAISRLLAVPAGGLTASAYNLISDQYLTEHDIARAIKRHLPDVVVEQDDTLQAPVNRVYSTRQLQADTGFHNWTPFSEGIRQVIASQRQQERIS